MRQFQRLLAPLLSHDVLIRLRWMRLGAVVLAVLDALGVLLVLPLIQLVTTLHASEDLAAPARSIASLLGATSRGDAAIALASVVIAVLLVKGGAAMLLLRLSIRTCVNAEAEMAGRLVNAYLHAPFQFHLEHNSADLQTTVHESLRHVYQEGLAFSVPALADRLVLVALGASMFVLAPADAIAGCASLALVAAAYRRASSRRALASSQEMLAQIRSSYRLTQQALTSIREITISGTAGRFTTEILDLRRNYAQRQAILSLTEQLPRYYLEIGLVGGTAAVAAVGFLLRPADEALAILGVFMVAGLRALPSLNRILNASAKADAAQPHLQRLIADLAEAGDQTGPAADTTPLDPSRRIATVEFDSVRFSYTSPTPVLEDISLTLDAGEMLAIVGSSGAGKTTMVSLLLGLIDPSAGEIRVDGRPLPTCRQSWQRRLAYVPQDVVVLDASIRANVAFGDATPDEERVWQALAAAQLEAVVQAMSQGLDQTVGEGGSRISGGQRQRLGLARALYQRPEFLVLDEATSSLDTETESRILDTLDDVRGKTTIVVVAHRLSTVRHCDRIAVLSGGGIEATGSFDELLLQSPTFKALALERSHVLDGE